MATTSPDQAVAEAYENGHEWALSEDVLEALTSAREGDLLEVVADTPYLKPEREIQPVGRVHGVSSDEPWDFEDPREEERTIRFGTRSRTYEIEVDVFDGWCQATARLVESTKDYQVGTEGRVLDAALIDAEIRWPVIGGTTSRVYHRPDPVALASDEARPACIDQTNLPDDQDYRVVNRGVVEGRKEPCIPCFARAQESGFEMLSCSECGTSIARALLQGPAPDAVTGVFVECPSPRCDNLEVVRLGD